MKKTDPPEELTREQRRALIAWCNDKYPSRRRHLAELVDQCLDHHRGEGNRKVDWVAVCRTWVRNDVKWARERRQTEQPQHDLGQREDEPTPLLELLRGGR